MFTADIPPLEHMLQEPPAIVRSAQEMGITGYSNKVPLGYLFASMGDTSLEKVSHSFTVDQASASQTQQKSAIVLDSRFPIPYGTHQGSDLNLNLTELREEQRRQSKGYRMRPSSPTVASATPDIIVDIHYYGSKQNPDAISVAEVYLHGFSAKYPVLVLSYIPEGHSIREQIETSSVNGYTLPDQVIVISLYDLGTFPTQQTLGRNMGNLPSAIRASPDGVSDMISTFIFAPAIKAAEMDPKKGFQHRILRHGYPIFESIMGRQGLSGTSGAK